MARLIALCSLPRTNPGNRLQYVRENGPTPWSWSRVPRTSSPSVPAAPLAGLGVHRSVRTQSRELVLGSSLSEFMRKLDVLSSDSGGTWGIRTRLRNQMDRLFSATISLIYEDDGSQRR